MHLNIRMHIFTNNLPFLLTEEQILMKESVNAHKQHDRLDKEAKQENHGPTKRSGDY